MSESQESEEGSDRGFEVTQFSFIVMIMIVASYWSEGSNVTVGYKDLSIEIGPVNIPVSPNTQEIVITVLSVSLLLVLAACIPPLLLGAWNRSIKEARILKS